MDWLQAAHRAQGGQLHPTGALGIAKHHDLLTEWAETRVNYHCWGTSLVHGPWTSQRPHVHQYRLGPLLCSVLAGMCLLSVPSPPSAYVG